MKETYVDKLSEQKYVSSVWKVVSISCMAVMGILAISVIFLTVRISDNVDRIRYILAPGVQTFTTVRPGEMPQSYIEEAFRFVGDKLNAWSYDSIKDNYKTLFEHFYSHSLRERTQMSLSEASARDLPRLVCSEAFTKHRQP